MKLVTLTIALSLILAVIVASPVFVSAKNSRLLTSPNHHHQSERPYRRRSLVRAAASRGERREATERRVSRLPSMDSRSGEDYPSGYDEVTASSPKKRRRRHYNNLQEDTSPDIAATSHRIAKKHKRELRTDSRGVSKKNLRKVRVNTSRSATTASRSHPADRYSFDSKRLEQTRKIRVKS